MANKKSNQNFSEIVQALCSIALILAISLSCLESNSNNSNRNSRNNDIENDDQSPTPTPKSNTNASPTPNTNASPTPTKAKSYLENLPAGFRVPDDAVGKRIMSEYGAVYVTRGRATPPPTVMFTNESECSAWQAQVKTSRAQIGSVSIELQEPAMMALQSAISEAQSSGLSLTPRGADSSKRTYKATVELWQSRVNPGLAYWVGKGRITQQEANRLKTLSPVAQVPEILRLEDQGIYFSKDFSKSILYSVAAPGTSQHLSMLALDVGEFENPSVRAILAKHGWYQTVVSDLPHFTYLGVPESELPSLGLKSVSNGGRTFWIPAL
jgi:hypothetical protein